jgi:hypothetical protein
MAPGGQSGGLTEADMGKAKMREYGNVSIPQEAFIATVRWGTRGKVMATRGRVLERRRVVNLLLRDNPTMVVQWHSIS